MGYTEFVTTAFGRHFPWEVVGLRDKKKKRTPHHNEKKKTQYFPGSPGKHINVDLFRFSDGRNKNKEKSVTPFSNPKWIFRQEKKYGHKTISAGIHDDFST